MRVLQQFNSPAGEHIYTEDTMLFHITHTYKPGFTHEDQKQMLAVWEKFEPPPGYDTKWHVFSPSGTMFSLVEAPSAGSGVRGRVALGRRNARLRGGPGNRHRSVRTILTERHHHARSLIRPRSQKQRLP